MATEALTTREQEVFDLHDSGMRNVDIAKELNIAPGTVSNALVKALRKLGLEDRIGGGAQGGGSTVSSGAVEDPSSVMKREGAKYIRRSIDASKAVEDFPGSFEEWLDNEREALEKQYNARYESMVTQAEALETAADAWKSVAGQFGIDLEEIEAEAQSEETAAAVAADAEAQSESEGDEDETTGEDETEEQS